MVVKKFNKKTGKAGLLLYNGFMKTKKGFTLLEILVVVLIIGILATIALPLYNKAVRKSRMAQAELFLKNASDAINNSMLQGGGKMGGGWDSFDIQFSGCTVSTGSNTVNNGFLDCGRFTYSIPIENLRVVYAQEAGSKEDFVLGKNLDSNTAFCAAADQAASDVCGYLDYNTSGGDICGALRAVCLIK